MAVNVNSDNRMSDLLVELNRHLKVCRQCTGAMKARDQHGLCDHTVGLVLTLAMTYVGVIPRRLKAGRTKQPRIYSCPDLTRHGQSYAMTAEPLVVVGVQEELF